MAEDWTSLLRLYRLRHGLTQQALADIMGVSQRTISRWERGDDRPTKAKQAKLRDLGLDLPPVLLANLSTAVRHCPAPRALSRMPNLQLLAVSGTAIAKRPSVADLLGYELARLATGILIEMLDDAELQRGIAKREICCVRSTTSSVLRTPESARIGRFRTTISYFMHDGTLYSDAISVPAPADAICGYEAAYQ
jgi:transcriptional regulator with XRE-family HTH domain